MPKLNIFSKKLLHITIQEKAIIISQLKDQNDRYKIFNTKKIDLNNLEIQDNKLFNLSQIFLILKNYLSNSKIKRANAIINFEKIPTDLIILQIVLCMTQINLKIKKIINLNNLLKENSMPNFLDKKEIDKQLDFFKQFEKPKTKFNIFFILLTIVTLSLEFIFLINFTKNKTKYVKNLQNQKDKLSANISNLKNELKIKENLAIINEKLTKQISKINCISKKNKYISTIFSQIPEYLPKETRLTKIIFNKNKQNKKQLIFLGQSFNQENIIKLVQNLEQNTNLYKIKVINIQKVKNLDDKVLYNFKIKSYTKNQ